MKNLFSVVLLVSVFSMTAIAEDMYGVFMVVKGDIKVKVAKTGKTEAVKIGAKVYPGDSITSAADSRGKIVMSDRNVIAISPDSQFTIESYKNDAAKGEKNVSLALGQGKIRANVEQKYDGEKNKFIIKSPTAVAGVRGTKFMMGFDPATQMAQVFTFSGQVQFGTPAAGGGIANPVNVNPGQMTSAQGGKPPETPKEVPKEEMKKLDAESSGDKVASKSPSDSSRGPASTDESKDGKKESGNENTGAPEQGSMVDASDMNTQLVTTVQVSPMGEKPPDIPMQFDPNADFEYNRPNEFLNDTIQGGGPSRLIIVPNIPQ